MSRITRSKAETAKGKKGLWSNGEKCCRLCGRRPMKGSMGSRNRRHLFSSMTARGDTFSCSYLRQTVRANAYG
ncbi:MULTISPECIES: hypothetical protein [Burkholderia cepacia complex]|uniref:hypothetical protein n=1 Tax=Burkholderia cepacia complex TaxID=87882 RepID=UPI001CF15ADD|nr:MULTISPECIES: hypothetical protein [Burkholderia cepacia complex]MCA8057152.1 hypothetical protein [Burkholderia cepacia]MDN7534658.1 hypothetical protein [Burkholderia orbicola]